MHTIIYATGWLCEAESVLKSAQWWNVNYQSDGDQFFIAWSHGGSLRLVLIPNS